MTLDAVLSLSARIAGFSILLSSLELLSNHRVLRDDGLMSWSIGRLRLQTFSVARSAPVWNGLLSYPNVLAFLALRAVFATTIVMAPIEYCLSPFVTIPLCALIFLVDTRTRYGHDGADQLASFTILSIAVTSLSPTPLARVACVLFLAFQACLAYGTAGWCKVIMPGWRDGTYLAAILATRIYGAPPLGRFLSTHPLLARIATIGVVGWECTFPLVLLVPEPMVWAILGMGVLFHILNAMLMGLNTFVWSFLATYPAVIWVIRQRGW